MRTNKYLFELQSELEKTFPGWRIAFRVDEKYRTVPRMAVLNSSNPDEKVTVPFPDDEKKRGENVYRALFAVLLEMAKVKYGKDDGTIAA